MIIICLQVFCLVFYINKLYFLMVHLYIYIKNHDTLKHIHNINISHWKQVPKKLFTVKKISMSVLRFEENWRTDSLEVDIKTNKYFMFVFYSKVIISVLFFLK
jgi:hypothetical protein